MYQTLAELPHLSQQVPDLGQALRRHSVSAKSEFLHSVNQRLPAQIQISGRLRLIPIELFESAKNEFFLDCFQGNASRREVQLNGFERGPLTTDRVRQVVKPDFLVLREYDQAFNDVL